MAKGRPKKVKSAAVPTEVVEEKPIEKVEVATETSVTLPELPNNVPEEKVEVEQCEPAISEESCSPEVEDFVSEEPTVEEKIDPVPETVETPKINDVSDFVSKVSEEQQKSTRDEYKLSEMIAQLKTMPIYKYLAKSSLIRIALKKIAQQKAKTL